MESVKVVVVTRFGIGMKDKAWYDYRYNIHKAFGQACMLDQTNQNFEWIICLDTDPPADFLQKLEEDFKDRKNVHLLRIKHRWADEYRSFINETILTDETEKLVFARRDDDDAVNINFIQNIYDFLQNNEVQLHFVPEKHSVHDDELTARVRPLQATFHWGKLIREFFQDSPDTLKHLFYGRVGTDIRVYYKNSLVGDVGRIAKHGKVDAQLQKLGDSIDGLRKSSIVPFTVINHYHGGFIFNAKGRNQFWPHHGTLAVACYSILPVENKRMTSFQDSIYENVFGHTQFDHCGPGITYNKMAAPAQYIYIRTQVNDCGGGGRRPSSTPRSLDNSLKKTFSITDEGWRLYLDTTTEYEVPRYSVGPHMSRLKAPP